MRIRTLFAILLGIFAFTLAGAVSQIREQLSAQDDPRPTPNFLSTNVYNDREYTLVADPSDYVIVYLTNPSTEVNADSPLALIPDISKAKIASRWEDVVSYNAQKPIEALIIDKSAYELIDFSASAQLSRRGTVIATINMYAQEQIEIRNSNCDRQKPAKNSPFRKGEDYFLVTVHLIQTEDPKDLDRAINMSYENCELLKSNSRVFETSKGTHGTMKSEDGVEHLVNSVMGAIDLVREAKTNLNNLSQTPTLAPEFMPELQLQDLPK